MLILLIGCGAEAQPAELGILLTPQSKFDPLPAELSTKLEAESVRMLGERNSRSYWIGRNDEDELCLVIGVNIGRPDWSAGLGCVNEEQFAMHGVSVAARDGNHFSSAIFVPDGYSQNLAEAFAGEFVFQNLVAFDSRDAVGGRQSAVVESDLGDKPAIEVQIPR